MDSLPIFLGRMADIQMPSAPPKIRSVSIFNFITDQEPTAGPYWITVYDDKMLSYRVTLYSNFVPEQHKGFYRISVECFIPERL